MLDLVGHSYSEYAKDESRRSNNGWSTFLCKSPVNFCSKMTPIVALSVTKAELFAAVLCPQDIMFVMRIRHSISFDIKLPMLLYVDNKGVNDMCNKWSMGGRTRHIDVKQYFL